MTSITTVSRRPAVESKLRLGLYCLILVALFWLYAGSESGTSFVYTNF